MKRIGIDARLINQTGVGSYTRNLLTFLLPLIRDDEEVYIFMRSQDIASYTEKHDRVHIIQADYTWHSFGEQMTFLTFLLSFKLDLMHFTYFSFPMFYPRPFVITIHDITPLLNTTGKASTKHPLIYHTKHLAYRLLMQAAVYRSSAILTPTHAVETDIIKNFSGVNPQKIHVTYEGISESLSKIKVPTKGSRPYPKSYYLFVGNFYPHKNIESLLHAFKEVRTTSQLVLAGPEDHFAQHIKDVVNQLHLHEKVRFIHSPSNEDLAYLYTHAQALVHPSKAEGFGLTLLEASSFHCPVLASDIPVFHETMGDHFTPFDPNDIYSIAAALQHFTDSPQKKFLPAADIERRFSFKKMAYDTYDIYKEILG